MKLCSLDYHRYSLLPYCHGRPEDAQTKRKRFLYFTQFKWLSHQNVHAWKYRGMYTHVHTQHSVPTTKKKRSLRKIYLNEMYLGFMAHSLRSSSLASFKSLLCAFFSPRRARPGFFWNLLSRCCFLYVFFDVKKIHLFMKIFLDWHRNQKESVKSLLSCLRKRKKNEIKIFHCRIEMRFHCLII